jgi:hypothetical protein
MANKTEERLLSVFHEASGQADAGVSLESLSGKGDAHADSASGYSVPAEPAAFDPTGEGGAGQSYYGTSGSSTSNNASGSGGSGIESLASSMFGGALGLVPLIGGLFGLFGGGSKQQPAFEKYEMPSSISFDAAEVGGSLENSGYGQMGLPRVYESSDEMAPAAPSNSSSQPGSPAAGGATPASAGASSSATPQISFNVQAIDAQSFMSYSGEIAKAVREAMLNLSSLNDVVTDL